MISNKLQKITNDNKSINIPVLTGDKDILLLKNPDRGFRTEIKYDVCKNGEMYNDNFPEPCSYLEHLTRYHEADSPMLAQSYFYLNGYKNKEQIPDEAFIRMQKYFDGLKKLNQKAVLRFAYQYDMETAEGEANQEIMEKHMLQLAPFLEKNKALIHVFQAGILGAWGEWHSYRYPIDKKHLLEKIIEITPKDLYIQVRTPSVKNLVSDNKEFRRISHHNDSVFGVPNPGTGGTDPMTEPFFQIARECPYMPVDGELFWGNWSESENYGGFYPDGFLVAKWLFDHRFTSFSLIHNYLEGGPDKAYAMVQWRRTEITKDWLKNNGMPFSDYWFRDTNGYGIKRNLFEYIRDYLGYRLQADKLNINGELKINSSIIISMEFKNYGFAAPLLFKDSGFCILDINGNVLNRTETGIPAAWFQRSPTEIDNYELLSHYIEGSIVLPSQKGKYYIGYYLKNSCGNGVRLANDLLLDNNRFDNNINILAEFEI